MHIAIIQIYGPYPLNVSIKILGMRLRWINIAFLKVTAIF